MIPFLDFSWTNYDAVALTTIITTIVIIIHFKEWGYLSQESFFWEVMIVFILLLFILQTIIEAAFIYCHLLDVTIEMLFHLFSVENHATFAFV